MARSTQFSARNVIALNAATFAKAVLVRAGIMTKDYCSIVDPTADAALTVGVLADGAHSVSNIVPHETQRQRSTSFTLLCKYIAPQL
jgi:hypothetical protein